MNQLVWIQGSLVDGHFFFSQDPQAGTTTAWRSWRDRRFPPPAP
jgi:hypothetical protein